MCGGANSAHDHDMNEFLVEVDELGKRYGSTEVLRGVSFTVRRGELFGLLGTNGAGKTTTVEILQGLRRADSGAASVLGLDPATSGDRLRRRIGAQLQDAALPDKLRVGEALRLFASLHASPVRSASSPRSGISPASGDARSGPCPAASVNDCSSPSPSSAGPSSCSSTS